MEVVSVTKGQEGIMALKTSPLVEICICNQITNWVDIDLKNILVEISIRNKITN